MVTKTITSLSLALGKQLRRGGLVRWLSPSASPLSPAPYVWSETTSQPGQAGIDELVTITRARLADGSPHAALFLFCHRFATTGDRFVDGTTLPLDFPPVVGCTVRNWEYPAWLMPSSAAASSSSPMTRNHPRPTFELYGIPLTEPATIFDMGPNGGLPDLGDGDVGKHMMDNPHFVLLAHPEFALSTRVETRGGGGVWGDDDEAPLYGRSQKTQVGDCGAQRRGGGGEVGKEGGTRGRKG
jgi:hypothetical protein